LSDVIDRRCRPPAGVLAGVAGASIACQGPTFAVNERIFELPSMKPAGGGCHAVQLGGSGRGATGAAGGGDGCAPLEEDGPAT
jgi:hypothetical protein